MVSAFGSDDLRASLVLSDRPRQGDPLLVTILFQTGEDGGLSCVGGGNDMAPPYAGLSLRLRFADGTQSLPAPVVPFPRFEDPARGPGGRRAEGAGPSARAQARPRAGFAAVSVAIGAPPGPAVASLYYGEKAVASQELSVMEREFRSETIRLDPALSSLRADPDPEKDRQALEYLELLARIEPSAAFLDGAFIRPVPAGNRRTSFFGDKRLYSYSNGSKASSVHAGIDYGYPVGTAVVAAGRGRVVMAQDRIVTGLTIVLEHLPGVYSIYMHLSRMDVSPGAVVGRGSPIGAIGSTGLATGPHLHWELRVLGQAADPEALIGIDKIPEIRTITAAIEGR